MLSHLRDSEGVRAEIIQRLLRIGVGNRIRSADFELMQEQFIELSMRPFDLTAVNRFAPIEHMHEQVCIVRGRFGSIAENLYFTLSKR